MKKLPTKSLSVLEPDTVATSDLEIAKKIQ